MQNRPTSSVLSVSKRLTGAVLGLTVAVLSASCVSQVRHDEVLDELRYYQSNYHALESFQGKLEAENVRLKGELELRGDGPIEAGATREMDDIDTRLSELANLMGSLGTAAGDVEVLAVEGGYGLRMSNAVLFDSGSSELKPEGRAILLKMANEIRSRPFVRVWVRGHTDSDPIVRAATKKRYPHGNLQLSASRAIEVAGALRAEGQIPSAKLVIAGFGPSDPVASNGSASSKAKNRRVEIFVIEEAGKGE